MWEAQKHTYKIRKSKSNMNNSVATLLESKDNITMCGDVI